MNIFKRSIMLSTLLVFGEVNMIKTRNSYLYSKLYLSCLLWIGLLIFPVSLFTANTNSLYAQCDPVRIMPLGDSITEGQGGDPAVIGGYREPLYNALTGDGYNIDFVGNRTEYSGAIQPSDLDHEGWPGRSTDTMENNIYSWLGKNEADIILVHTGTNDITPGQKATEILPGQFEDKSIIMEVEELLDNIDRYENDNSKEITVFLARIINRRNPTSSIPASLLGATYIKTANDDKASTTNPFLSFDVDRDAVVYVAHNDKIITKPSWLSSFTDTGDNLFTTDSILSIFKKNYPAGTVTLGGNEGDDNSMYTVIIEGQSSNPVGISNLTVASGRLYEVVENGLQSEALAYIDRSFTYTAQGQETTLLNIAIQNLADTRIASGDKIVVVDMEALFDYTQDLEDGVHPNEAGYLKMAVDGWYPAITNYLSSVCAPTDPSSPNGVIDAPVGDQTINAGDSINFSGTGTDPDNNTPLTYHWDFGAGSGIVDSTQENPGAVQFNNIGTFVVTFTVTDDLGYFDPTPGSRTITVLKRDGGVPLVISNLTVASGQSYEVVQNGLLNGARVYIDRGYTYSSVPAFLQGTTYIKTANDDKASSSASFLSFEVNQDVFVYVAHDDAIGMRPSWLTSSFSDTGDNLVTTDTTLSIFESFYSTGTVVLGGNEGSNNSMYSVIIVEQGGPGVNQAPDGVIDTPFGNQTINTGGFVNFTGTGTDPDTGQTLTYLWDFGAGSGITDSTVEGPGDIQFNTPGTYVVTFKVKDSLGASDPTPDTRTITVLRSDGGDPLVISNLTVASGKSYEVVQNGLLNSAMVYIDRGYTYSSIPAFLQGATYIKTANDDKASSSASFLSFEVNQNVNVYVAHDDAVGMRPSWLTSSFSDTGDNLVTTDTTLSIFESNYPAGTVTLGGNRGGNNSMYSVIIVGQGGPGGINQAPDGVIDAHVGDQTFTGDAVYIRGDGTDPDNNTPLTYHWDFGAGSGIPDKTRGGVYLPVQFNTPGTYVVTLTVTDSLGLSDPTPDTVTITVQSNYTDGYEPDDSDVQAIPISSGELQTHSIYPVGDEDWMTFVLTSDSEVIIETSSLIPKAPSRDIRMWLYDSSLNEVDFDDNSGRYLFSRIDRVCGTDELAAGTYYVKVDEFSDNNEIGSYDISLTVTPCGGTNQAPDGQIDVPVGDQTINAGGFVNFTGYGTDPDNNLPLTYLWNFGTGSGITDSTVGEEVLVKQFNNPGTYDVTFTVTDSLGLSDPTPDTRTITVQSIGCTPDGYEPDDSNVSATPILSGETQTHSICPVGDEDWVTFTLASDSEVIIETSGISGDTRMWLYDSSLNEIEYNDDDGAIRFSRIDRVCGNDELAAGTYYVKIDGFGNNNEIDSYDISLTVMPCGGTNQVPNGVIDTPVVDQTINAGDSVNFMGYGVDPDGNALSYLWDFGAGSGIADSTQQVPGLVQFNNPGTFVVTFTVRDSQGLSDPTPAISTITVHGGAVCAGPDLVVVGVDYTKSNPFPGDYQVMMEVKVKNQGCEDAGAFYIDWYADLEASPVSGDHSDEDDRPDSLAAGATYTMLGEYHYSAEGCYNTYVKVDTDDDGEESNENNNILGPVQICVGSIANQEPAGVIDTPVGNQTINAGDSVSFSGTGMDPDNNTPLTYLWDFGAGSGIPDKTSRYPYVWFSNPGTFVVTLTVTDSLGLSDPTPDTVTITVLSNGCITDSKFEQAIMTNRSQVWTDRDYYFVDVPENYHGKSMLRTPMGDSSQTGASDYLTFTMPVDGYVYVGYDAPDFASSLPNWLINNFADTGNTIEVFEDNSNQLRYIYTRYYNQGDCVNLGGNRGPGYSRGPEGNSSNYIVFYDTH